MVERLFPAVPRGCLQFKIVVFPDHPDFLSSPGILFFSKTNLSDLSIVGTCELFVYRMRHQIICSIRLVDSKNCYRSASSHVTETTFLTHNVLVIVSLNTVIPISVIV